MRTKFECDFGENFPPRISFERLPVYLQEKFDTLQEDEYFEISPMTDFKIAVPAFNLVECFFDYRVKMPVGDYGMFKLLEDQGIFRGRYGDAGGYSSDGYYRSFLIKINDRVESVSFSIFPYCTCANSDVMHTGLSIAIDNEQELKSHHALQISLDNDDYNMEVIRNTCHFYHSGKITVGNIGRGKKADLREFVRKKCPELIHGDRFYFGSLVHDRLWRLDDPKVIKIIRNMICYAEIADEYREHRKRTYKKKS